MINSPYALRFCSSPGISKRLRSVKVCDTSMAQLTAEEEKIPNPYRELYPPIEPYSSGFFKVSDLHTIYWEQSGNPSGYVSGFYLSKLFGCLLVFIVFIILTYLSVFL